MSSYKGKYPKHITAVYSLKDSRNMGVRLNDGSHHEISAAQANGVIPKPGEEISKYFEVYECDVCGEPMNGANRDYGNHCSHSCARDAHTR